MGSAHVVKAFEAQATSLPTVSFHSLLIPFPSLFFPSLPFREAKSEGKLGSACLAKVFEAQLEAAQEIAFDPILNETCSKDVERLCKDVEPGEGRIQECLVRFLSVQFLECCKDVERLCKDVEPGEFRSAW